MNGQDKRQGYRKVRSARGAAFEVLRHLEVEATSRSSEVLARALRDLPDPRERALTTELVYGVLRWRRRLDTELDPLLARGVAGVELAAQVLLRLGVYQLRMLDRIPPEIVVSATQDAAREVGFDRLTGILNAVLRKVASRPDSTAQRGTPLAIQASLPGWIMDLVRARYGDEAEREAFALRERAPLTLRPTLTRGGLRRAQEALAHEGIGTRVISIDGEPLLLECTGGDPFATRAFQAGLFVAQDPASLMVVTRLERLLGGLEGKRVLDLCAGRGVKTTALLDRGARVVACDVGAGKLRELERAVVHLGLQANLEMVVTLDATDAEAVSKLGTFDAVLVDAPCSGLGTLRRHPEIAWRREENDIKSLRTIQQGLATAAQRALKPEGVLVYAVCSFVAEEGQVEVDSSLSLIDAVDLPPSAGLDAFQVKVWRA